jgi:hypothetical protein
MSKTSNYTPRPNRQEVTRESDPGGRWTPQFPDMIGYTSQGGGKVPEDFGWHTNPKQWQEELTEDSFNTRPSPLPLPQGTPQGEKKPESK